MKPTAPRPTADRPLSVGELSRKIQHLLEDGIGAAHVTGEISNLRIPASGHAYFMLKDADAAINAVCFRATLARQTIRPADGMQVEIRGQVTAYTPRSEYQIIIRAMREAGLGDLMRRFLELKERLKAEGLFDSAIKQAIPRLPRRVGIVTSSTGAALRDMLNILGRRVRGLDIYLSPSAVQGENAPAEIVEAIERLVRHHKADVIIVGRGGGSIEDLWAFNDERVVRAIAACPIPVISAVGHETDTTLSDYAADLRAPTPSAAAELVSADYGELLESLAQLKARLNRDLAARVAHQRMRLERCIHSWAMRRPQERLSHAMQRLDDMAQDLTVTIDRDIKSRRDRLGECARRLALANPQRRLRLMAERLDRARSMLLAVAPSRWKLRMASQKQTLMQLGTRVNQVTRQQLHQRRWALDVLVSRLHAASPEAILQRGYSIVTHGKRQRPVTRPEQVKTGEIVRIRSAGGAWRAATLPPGDDLFDPID